MARKLKYPLRYYLHKMMVNVGGYEVEYTPADVHSFDIIFDGRKVGRLRVIGGYSFVGFQGLELRDSEKAHYAGEL